MKTQQKENKNNNDDKEKTSHVLSQGQKDFIDSRLNHYYNNPNDLMDFDDLLEKLESTL